MIDRHMQEMMQSTVSSPQSFKRGLASRLGVAEALPCSVCPAVQQLLRHFQAPAMSTSPPSTRQRELGLATSALSEGSWTTGLQSLQSNLVKVDVLAVRQQNSLLSESMSCAPFRATLMSIRFANCDDVPVLDGGDLSF